MIPHIESGISGFDDFTSTSMGKGGIPENSFTLIYGPPNTGKSLFSYQFLFNGLKNEEPGLFISTVNGIYELENFITHNKWFINIFFKNDLLFIIDAQKDPYPNVEGHEAIVTSFADNPTDLMVKVVAGIRYFREHPRFRSVLDSLTTLLELNDQMLIMRVLKTYIMRIKESGGSGLITYVEGSADQKTEIMIKSMVDNIIRLDGNTLHLEAMKGLGRREASYEINDDGLIIK